MIPEGYEEGRIAMRIARLLPVIAVAISLLANRNNAGWTTFPGLRTPNLQKENRRCRVRRDTPQAVFGWADRFRQSANAVGDQSAAIGRDAAKLGNVALTAGRQNRAAAAVCACGRQWRIGTISRRSD